MPATLEPRSERHARRRSLKKRVEQPPFERHYQRIAEKRNSYPKKPKSHTRVFATTLDF